MAAHYDPTNLPYCLPTWVPNLPTPENMACWISTRFLGASDIPSSKHCNPLRAKNTSAWFPNEHNSRQPSVQNGSRWSLVWRANQETRRTAALPKIHILSSFLPYYGTLSWPKRLCCYNSSAPGSHDTSQDSTHLHIIARHNYEPSSMGWLVGGGPAADF